MSDTETNNHVEAPEAPVNFRERSKSFVKREPAHRVFVNRSLNLQKIKFFGFDMDYTLAQYKSPQYEILGFNLVIGQLIKLGYPKEIENFQYDPDFPVRGLWYDKLYGNLLKVDTHGNILVCVHGFKFLKTNEIYKYYPNKFINYDSSRIYPLITLFNLPETYLLACMVNFFSTSKDFEQHPTGVSTGEVFISYKAIFQDVRQAVDNIHDNGSLKEKTVANLEEYVEDNGLEQGLLFNRMRENNTKVFLLTNSGYDYTNAIMGFLLNDKEPGRNWRSYFDYILVDARKPLFFEEGTSMKEIEIETGATKFGSHSGPLRENKVYSGGNCDVFSKLIGSRGKDVLYVGDHIFGDIIKSKKERAWRTFLIVPELSQEMAIWHENREIFSEMHALDQLLSVQLVNFDSSSKNVPDITSIKEKIYECIHKMDMNYSKLGSLFRTGSRQTHFASQVTRYADIYAASHLNLLHYPFFYLFKSPAQLMPHESTVNPYEHSGEDAWYSTRRQKTSQRCSTSSEAPAGFVSSSMVKLMEEVTIASASANIMPDTPKVLTHHEEFDDDDEDSDEPKTPQPIKSPFFASVQSS